jgi:hypothetical protein
MKLGKKVPSILKIPLSWSFGDTARLSAGGTLASRVLIFDITSTIDGQLITSDVPNRRDNCILESDARAHQSIGRCELI